MNFTFSEDQELLRETTRSFLRANQPLSRIRPVLEADETVDAGDWRAGADLGWSAMLVPAEYGGGSVTGQPLVDLVVLAEELGRVLHPAPLIPTNVVADALARYGSEAQRGEFLRAIAIGDLLAAWCLSADGTADLEMVGVHAVPDGGGYRLDGTARLVHGASAAGIALVSVTTPCHLLEVIVRLDDPGVTIRNVTGLDLTRRYAEVRFLGVGVPADAVLAAPGAAVDELVDRALMVATVLQAAEAVGAADHLLATTVQYAKDRVQFGRPIGSFQAIKHRLADLQITVEAMRAATHYAALAVNDCLPDAAEAVCVAGSYVGEAYPAVCGEALQLHGGIGFTWEHDVHLFLRRARVDEVLYGEPWWHGERLCRWLEEETAGEVA